MKRKRSVWAGAVLGLVIMAGSSGPALAGFQEGVAAYEAGDYKAAFDEWLPLAKANDPAAMRNIGHMYRRGLGVPQDYKKALTWYMRAATLGFDRAEANVAGMYLKGEGVEQNYAQAAKWFARAAQQGHVISQYNLALMLENGLGVQKNERAALEWYRLAAKAGHPESIKKVSVLEARLNLKDQKGAAEKIAATAAPKAGENKTAESGRSSESSAPIVKKGAVAQSEAPVEKAEMPADAGQSVSKEVEKKAGETAKSAEKPPLKKKGFFEALKSLVVTTTPAPQTSQLDTGTAKSPESTLATAEKPSAVLESAKAASVQPAPAKGGLSTAEKLEMADLAYTLKEYQQSLSIWAELAKTGNAEAQYRLGGLFESGRAVPVDRVRAYYWWEKARAGGSKEAEAALASLEKSLTDAEKRQIDRLN
ncbi:MAG: hypothetical protein EP348_09780 [Alphaproteobacteria bacterium]|nr:MAG: hypothetical protein EP348_09780 [Alphaproteobacteria bacterium]